MTNSLYSFRQIVFLGLSALIHAFFLLYSPSIKAPTIIPSEKQILIQLPSRQRTIVTQHLASNTETPAPNAFLAEKNVVVKKEQIKRSSELRNSKPQQAKNQDRQEQQLQSRDTKRVESSSEGKNIKELFPSENHSFSPRSEDVSKSSKAIGKSASGIPDFLPQLRDGEITLLNTKAHRFAVFVKRVAHRVFAGLKTNLWNSGIGSSGIMSAAVYVTLDAEGNVSSVTSSSSSSPLLSRLKTAAKNNAWDKNPPREAYLEDGKIHFVFQARVKFFRQGPRNGVWIQLGTGLK